MTLEREMLSAVFLQAIASIPPAIKALQDLLSSSKPDITLARTKIEDLKNSIGNLSDISSWLIEAKELHTSLQRLDNALEPTQQLYYNAVQGGTFLANMFNMQDARKAWRVIKNEHLIGLISFISSIKAIDVKYNTSTQSPDWIYRFISYMSDIDALFISFNGTNLDVSAQIAEKLDQLFSHNKFMMNQIDYKIIDQASRLANELIRLKM